MLLNRDSHYLFFASGDPLCPNQISKLSVNKKEVVAKFEGPFFEGGIGTMALSPDSNSLYVGSRDRLHQFSLRDGKVIQSRNINDLPDIRFAIISAMRVTKNNEYLITGIAYFGTPEKGSKEDLSGKTDAFVGGRACVWSTKDLTLVKT